jgi:hypothetical protein
MSSDLLAGVVGLTLGIAVVVVGLRRNLSNVTRSGLPRYGGRSEATTAPPEFFDVGQGRHQLSPWERKLSIWLYLFMSLSYAAFAVLKAEDRLLHVFSAVLAIAAMVFMLRRPSS